MIAPLLLAAAGAAVLLVLVEGAGGDFGDWPQWQAIAVPVAAFVVPAALWPGLFGAAGGVVEALLWAIAASLCSSRWCSASASWVLGYGPE